MTLAIRINWSNGVVFADSSPIMVDSSGALSPAVARWCRPPEIAPQGNARYHFSRQASLLGHVADCVVDVARGKVDSVTLLFGLIEYFDASVMESRIVKAVETDAHARFANPHPAVAVLESLPWGEARFSYDFKQGGLSLLLQFQ